DAAGYDRKLLRCIVLTHAHWDHVSGVPDFPGVPVLLTAAEYRFIDVGGFATETARSMKATAAFQGYAFDPVPYLGFDQSRDLYRDGSIVIVPVPGHTPGSVAIFVTPPAIWCGNSRAYWSERGDRGSRQSSVKIVSRFSSPCFG